MRTPGIREAALSAALHECAMTGHGQDAAPHVVSVVLGAFQGRCRASPAP